jgi:hypothetical protein
MKSIFLKINYYLGKQPIYSKLSNKLSSNLNPIFPRNGSKTLGTNKFQVRINVFCNNIRLELCHRHCVSSTIEEGVNDEIKPNTLWQYVVVLE